jgi:hypothetical protein
MYVLFFHWHLHARTEQSRAKQRSIMTCARKRQQADGKQRCGRCVTGVWVEVRTTPLASARGTGEEAAREAEGVPKDWVNAVLRCCV